MCHISTTYTCFNALVTAFPGLVSISALVGVVNAFGGVLFYLKTISFFKGMVYVLYIFRTQGAIPNLSKE